MSTKATLSGTVILFGVFTIIPILIDRATGGRIKGLGELDPTYGTYTPDILFPIFMISGISLEFLINLRYFLWDGRPHSSCNSPRHSRWRCAEIETIWHFGSLSSFALTVGPYSR